MASKILFWSGFGIAVRCWQLGIQMRPFFAKEGLWAYPAYGSVGAAFGYWINGVDESQARMLEGQKTKLLERRRRRAELQLQNEASSNPDPSLGMINMAKVEVPHMVK